MFNFILISFKKCNWEIYLGKWTLIWWAIKVPYKTFAQRNYFYGLQVLFSRRKKKDPLAILHKIRDSHVY